MKGPLVSTLICTYNAENTIHRALQSVLDQTYKNQEILILENNSIDNTLNILKEYQKKDNRIHIFSLGKNLGAYGGLNFLLDHSKGKYIAIQDHDDVRHPKKLKTQIDFLESNNQYIGCGTGYLEYYCKSKIGHIVKHNQNIVKDVGHTSLVFRNIGNLKYDKYEFLGDAYFMQKILRLKGAIFELRTISVIHYNKENKLNYSNSWYSLNKENFKRYISVTSYKFIIIAILKYFFIYIKTKNILLTKLTTKILNKDIKYITDRNIIEMIKYLN